MPSSISNSLMKSRIGSAMASAKSCHVSLPLGHGALHSLSRLLDFINRLNHGGVGWLRTLSICELEVTFAILFHPAFILGLSTILDPSSLELVRRDLGGLAVRPHLPF